MADLQAGPLAYDLNNADNHGSDAEKARAMKLLWDHRWELQVALELVERLKLDLRLNDVSTARAAELIPPIVDELLKGTVNGRWLRRAIEAEQKLEGKGG